MQTEEIALKVGELTNREEFGRGIVRIDTKTMKALDVREGDVVEIHGQRKTGVIAVRAYPQDIGLNLIRMDGISRRNAGIGVGETVKITKAKAVPAKRVVLAPTQKGMYIQMSPDLLRKNLFMRPVNKRDIITPFPVVKQRSQSPFDDFFGINIEEMFFTPMPADTKFVVVSTIPEGIVRISDYTELELRPEAVDIEEKTMPTITYEEIGGLEEPIQKIREMVELPLRHPELFTRLGIDPPKGVLLYGPPGTGKTLLAKAVANESGANFITISGPEIISKWYGESLPHNEKILVVESGRILRKPIGQVVEEKTASHTAAFDENGKIQFSPITDFIAHRCTSPLLEVQTATGRKLRVTDYHSLFTLHDGKITDVRTHDLIPGKSFVAVPRRLPFPETPQNTIDFLDALREDDYGLTIDNPADFVRQAIEKIGKETVKNILGKKDLYFVLQKGGGIRVSRALKLAEAAGISLNKDTLRISSAFGKKSLPALIPVDSELSTFLGLWVAEGSYNREGTVRLSISESEVEKVAQMCMNLFGHVTLFRKPYGEKEGKGVDVYIGSRVLYVLMRHVLGLEDGAERKKTPLLAYMLNQPNLAAFLRGYFSGDGTIYCNQRGIAMVEASTVSKELADDLLYLLLRFGIVARLYGKEEKHGLPAFRVYFTGSQPLSAFTAIGFLDAERNQRLADFLSSIKWTRSDQIPLEGSMRDVVLPSLSEWKHSPTAGREKLLQVAQQTGNGLLLSLAQNDIFWDKVVAIRPVEPEEYVYDLSVSPGQNFVAGFGGIFAHNSEKRLRDLFIEAEKNAPSIIFIDEIDSIAPKREEVTGEVERRVVSTLLTTMDGMKARGKVIVIAATNRQNAIDPALRRPGRFDREIEIGVPDAKGRKEILQIHSRNMPLTADVDLAELAQTTHGFVGADLEALAKEAAMSALRKHLPEITWKKMEEIPEETLEKLKVTKADFKNALKLVEPSAMREVAIEIPNVKWADIGGLETVKEALKEAVEWPLLYPQSFKRLGIRPPSGILLFGPPGTGKTMLAKAVATESGANFISIKGPELISKFVGDSEKHVREVFRRAKQVAPAVIFFDEIDSMAPRRSGGENSHTFENVVSQILTEMSGLESMQNVVVIAATNRPDMIDPALLRPGRFDRQILVPAPDEKTRLDILKVQAKKMPLEADVSLEELAKRAVNYTGADLEALVREAGMQALRVSKEAKIVSKKHFDAALKIVYPSVTPKVLEFYRQVEQALKTPPVRERKAKPVEAENTSYFG